jgi:hypothetical protein
MFILQIEHPVMNYDGWKKAFDSDPMSRQKSGVRRYRILRPTDIPRLVIIELEFDKLTAAEGMLASLRELWRKVEGKIIETAKARITEVTEQKEYPA